MKAAELKDLTSDELTRRAGEIRENLFNLKIRRRSGTLDSTADVTKNKRDLARILTVLTQKQGSSKAQQRSQKTAAAAAASTAASPAAPATGKKE